MTDMLPNARAMTYPAIVSIGPVVIGRFETEDRTQEALVKGFRKWKRENEPRLNRQVSIRFVDADRSIPGAR